MAMRLDRALSEATTLPRAQLRRLIAQGQARVNGQAARDPAGPVDPGTDEVELCGERVRLGPVYLMLNKPAGVVSASRDAREKTVVDLVPPALRRKNLFPAGRLDRDTEGFVLLTDDGGFAHRILSPKRHVPKTYLCRVAGPLDPDAPRRFREGLTLPDGTVCRSAGCRVIEGGDPALVEVVLHEGMYHQIKRMIACCGGRVVGLRRTRIGGLELDGALAPGACRELTRAEVAQITQTSHFQKDFPTGEPFCSD